MRILSQTAGKVKDLSVEDRAGIQGARTIGKRIARRRKHLKQTQVQVAERAEISEQYLSNIERAVSISSTEAIMRLAIALDTTPDEFLVGAVRRQGVRWKDTAQLLQNMDERQLDLAESFLTWLSEHG